MSTQLKALIVHAWFGTISKLISIQTGAFESADKIVAFRVFRTGRGKIPALVNVNARFTGRFGFVPVRVSFGAMAVVRTD